MKRNSLIWLNNLFILIIFFSGISIFAENKSDVFVDEKTGLMWLKNANYAGKGMTWDDAAEYCKNLNVAGYDDWRLPTEREYYTLIDGMEEGEQQKGLAKKGFKNVQRFYWTSDELSAESGIVFVVDQQSATIKSSSADGNSHDLEGGEAVCLTKTINYYVWPVRGEMEDSEDSSLEKDPITAATEEIERNPDDARAYYNRGVEYQDINEFDEAIKDYTRAINLDLKCVPAYYDRSICYMMLGEYDEAIADISRVIELSPDNEKGYICRAYIYFESDQFENAINDCNEAININSKSSDHYISRGWYYWVIGECDRAFADYNAALNLGSENYAVYFNIGLYYIYYKKDKAKALEYFEKAFQKGYDPYNEGITNDNDKKNDGYYMKNIINDPVFKRLQKKYKK